MPDIDWLEFSFDDLRRTFSAASAARRVPTTATTDSHLEKAEEHDDFDLLEYMKGDLEKRDQAGFKHKEIGVIFKDLSVIGAGGMKVNQ